MRTLDPSPRAGGLMFFRARSRRLSRRVKWIRKPTMYQSGFLYFRLTMPLVLNTNHGDDHSQYASVRGVQRRYWLDHLLNYTNAVEVEIIRTEA